MRKALTDSLRRVAAVLAPCSEPKTSGALRWNGSTYVPGGPAEFDPYAAKWRGMLSAIAELIDGQDAPLSIQQKGYLDRLLFGGMGSFNDFGFEEDRLGPDATKANQKLAEARKVMFAEFQRL